MDQTETSITSFTTTDRELENTLKDLLERVLVYVEKYIETKEELNQVESELKDYESLQNLVGIIKAVFTKLMLKIEKRIQKLEKYTNPNYSQFSKDDEEYEKLEQNLIKYESEIRKHISIEQQLKLYAESVQSKLDESEQIRQELLETTKNNISKLKRENNEYYEKEQQLQAEIVSLKQTISQFEKDNKKKLLEANQRDTLQALIQKQQQSTQQKGVQYQKLIPEKRQSVSFSEHKPNQIIAKDILDINDVAIPTQQSQKLNYYSIVNYINHHKKSDVIKTQQQKELQNIYGQIMKSKHNSLSSINDIMQTISQQDKRKNDHLNSISKNSSQNNSVIQRTKDSIEFQNQRSRSSKRPEDTYKQKTLESLIKLK